MYALNPVAGRFFTMRGSHEVDPMTLESRPIGSFGSLGYDVVDDGSMIQANS